ncbi:54S ribosomal protein L7, mitochondrial [Coemansia guatemalensis]|uniref:54S ribosomal protein L7, mitochondrial n=1 Tax=Coemansia guatemalensis TaxID=2761395 RepID=A0A9W8I457_9FUNG|nr:54S ribosomal protein L7, mitochondrial [Coemansia guatemalensis]
MIRTLARRFAAPSQTGRRTFACSAAQGYQSRLAQFYHNTLRDDLTILTYVPPAVRAQRDAADAARVQASKGTSTDGAPNPNRKHRVKVHRAKTPKSTAHNAPCLKSVYVHIRCREAINDKNHILSAMTALQVITGKRAELIKAKTDVATWKLRKGMPIAAKVELRGEEMFEFLDKLFEIVLPRMKEYGGMPMSAGDGNGNFTIGFDESVIGLFPEMEMAYDMFPLVNGFIVNIATSATRNPPARLLLSGLGLPFLHERKPESEAYML